MIKRLIILLIATLTVFSGWAYVYDFEVNGIYYKKNPDGISASVAGSSLEYTYIPSAVMYSAKHYNVTSIGRHAFYNRTNLKEVSIPFSVTSIEDEAFYGCTSLRIISTGQYVTTIGKQAFLGCSNLSQLEIRDAVESIGERAFWRCENLTTVTIPKNVTSIGNEAFSKCSKLSKINFNAISCSYMGTYDAPVFKGCTNLTSVNIANNVTLIPPYAFNGCENLPSVTLPATLTSIGCESFRDCKGLKSMTIPNSVNYIGEGVFAGCSNLETFYGKYVTPDNKCIIIDDLLISYAPVPQFAYSIPNSVTSIGNLAFYNCNLLGQVTLGEAVTSIGSEAFYGCKNLEKVINKSLLDLEIGSEDHGYVAYYAKKILSFSNQEVIDDFWFNSETKTLEAYTGDKKSMVLPESYHGDSYSIGNYVFSGQDFYTVTIPNKVTSIGNNAFYGCQNLTSVILGTGLTEIGEDAFAACPNLVKLFAKGNTKPVGIESAFAVHPERVTYTSNDKYNGIECMGSIKKYSSLGSLFETDGVIYIPVSMSGRTCDVVDCSYSPEVTNIDIQPTVLYKGVVFTVLQVNENSLRNNSYLTRVELNYIGVVNDHLLADSKNVSSLVLGPDITSFGVSPFKNLSALTSLSISEGTDVLRFDDVALFRDCQLKELVLGRDVAFTLGNADDSYSPFSGMQTLRSLKVGQGVSHINDYLFYHTALEGLISFPNGLSHIGDYAFAGAKDISRLVFSSSIESIGDYAFLDANPGSLRFPASLQSVGVGAFDACSAIESIRFDDSVETLDVACEFKNSGTKSVYVGRNFSAGQKPFADNKTITSAELSETVTTLNSSMFANCSGLKVVNIPSRVTLVPDSVFIACSSLEGIDFPEAVSEIGVRAFDGSGLKSVTIRKTIKNVGMCAFSHCENLQYAQVGCANLGEAAFASSGLLQVDLTTDVNSIGYLAFGNCANMKSASIGAASIGNCAFKNCSSLASVVLDARTKSIGTEAFRDCGSLASINIPEGNTQLAFYALAGTSSLAEITLPQSLVAIGDKAFKGSGLRSLIIPSAVATIGAEALAETENLALLTFDDSGEAIIVAGDAFVGMGVETANINRQFNYDTTLGSPFKERKALRTVTMNDRASSLLAGMFEGCTALQSVRVSANVTEIGEAVFKGASSLTTVNIPQGVKEIKSNTFNGCSSLTAIDLMKVTKLGQYSFADAGLKSVVINPVLTQIALGAFKGCNGLEEFVALSGNKSLEISNSDDDRGMFADSPLRKVSVDRPLAYSILPQYGYSPFYRITTLNTVELGDYVPEVPDNMFYGCTGLTDVVIGDGVKSFGKYAFSGCQSIQRFYFGGNVESIGEEAFSDCSAMVELWSQAVNPPVCSEQALDDIDKFSCELYVPLGTIDRYAAADQWQDFLFAGESTGKSIMATGISLSKLSLDMKIDDTANIVATILPTSVQDNFPVSWSSSDENVAVVTNGKVIAVGEGECQIIATAESNGIIMSACNVKVNKLDQELMWVQAFGGVYIGDQITFTGKADSGLDIKYTITGGDAVGTLSNNIFTINDVGTVEITAQQPGDNRYYASNSVVRSLTVIPVNPKNISVNNDVTVHVGQTLSLSAQIEPINAYDKSVSWRSLDESILTVDGNGVITGVYNGETYVVATASNGLMANCHVTVNSLGDDYICINDAEIAARETWEMPILLNNAQPIMGAEFDIELPNAISFVKSDEGYLVTSLSERGGNHEVMATLLDDKTAHIEVYTLGSDAFTGTSGDVLMTIPVVGGTSKVPVIVKVSNVKLYSESNETIMPGSDNASITITGGGLMGDVNENGEINISDVVMIVSDVVGITQPNYNASLADVDNNGSVTITDAVWVVRYVVGAITSFPNQVIKRSRALADLASVAVTAEQPETDYYDVTLSLNSMRDIAGLQLTINIPDGFELVENSLAITGNMQDFYTMVNDENSSIIKIVALSTSSAPLTAGDEQIVTMTLQRVNPEVSYGKVIISDIEVADNQGLGYELDDAYCSLSAEISGLESINGSESIIRVEGMKILLTLPMAQRVMLTNLSGQTSYYELPEGNSEIEVNTPGLYIISTCDKVNKIILK